MVKDPEQLITRLSPLAVRDCLEIVAPDGVLHIRPTGRLNLLAVDTRTCDATERLLITSVFAGAHVEACEHRSFNYGVGVII